MDPRYKDIGHPAARTTEECAELIQILMKAKRFGWWNHHPDDPAKVTNHALTLREIEDVERSCALLKSWLLSSVMSDKW